MAIYAPSKRSAPDLSGVTPRDGLVYVADPEGIVYTVPAEGARIFLEQNPDHRLAQDAEITDAIDFAQRKAKFGGPLGATGAAIAGTLRGVTGGLSDVYARGTNALADELGVGEIGRAAGLLTKPETLRDLEEFNPKASIAGEVVGTVVPAVLSGGMSLEAQAGARGLATAARATVPGMIEYLGATGAKKLGGGIAGRVISQGLGTGAAYGALQGVSEAALGDPNEVVDHVMAGAGTGALWGGGVEGALGALGFAGGAIGRSVNRARKALGRVPEGSFSELPPPLPKTAVQQAATPAAVVAIKPDDLVAELLKDERAFLKKYNLKDKSKVYMWAAWPNDPQLQRMVFGATYPTTPAAAVVQQAATPITTTTVPKLLSATGFVTKPAVRPEHGSLYNAWRWLSAKATGEDPNIIDRVAEETLAGRVFTDPIKLNAAVKDVAGKIDETRNAMDDVLGKVGAAREAERKVLLEDVPFIDAHTEYDRVRKAIGEAADGMKKEGVRYEQDTVAELHKIAGDMGAFEDRTLGGAGKLSLERVEKLEKLAGGDPLLQSLTPDQQMLYLTEANKLKPLVPDFYTHADDMKRRLYDLVRSADKRASMPSGTTATTNTLTDLRNLYNGTVKASLEDSAKWGAIGPRQAALNKKTAEFIEAKDRLEARFLERDPGRPGDFVISHGKVKQWLETANTGQGERNLDEIADYLQKAHALNDEIERSYQFGKISTGFDKKAVTEVMEANRKYLNDMHYQAETTRLSKGLSTGSQFGSTLALTNTLRSGGRLGTTTMDALGFGVKAGVAGAAFGPLGAAVAVGHSLYTLGRDVPRAVATFATLKRIADTSRSRIASSVEKLAAAKDLASGGGLRRAVVAGGARYKAEERSREEYRKEAREIRLAVAHPEKQIERAMRAVKPLDQIAPQLSVRLQIGLVRSYEILNKNLPERPRNLPPGVQWNPSPEAIFRYNRIKGVVLDPGSFSTLIEDGSVTSDLVAVMDEAHPYVMTAYREEIMRVVTTTPRLSQRAKTTFSIVLGQPIDPLLRPEDQAIVRKAMEGSKEKAAPPPPSQAGTPITLPQRTATASQGGLQ